MKNTFLTGLSWIYSALVAANRFRMKRKEKAYLQVPVFSVGNVTVGGTGKTEAVALLCQELMHLGYKPGILTRGYKRQSTDAVVIASKGNGPIVKAEQSGDEPYLLAEKIIGAAVVVGKNRFQTGQLAIEQCGCTAIVLDDGFQRRDELHRDLDVVLVDAGDPFGDNALLPKGRLRESLPALKEADVLIITRADQHDSDKVLEKLETIAPECPVLLAKHEPEELVHLRDNRREALSYLQDKNVLVVSAIARPKAFEKTLVECGALIKEHLIFRDHYWYQPEDIKHIYNRAHALQSEVLITTKDQVKMNWQDYPAISAWALTVRFSIIPTNVTLSTMIQKGIQTYKNREQRDR